MKVDMSTLVLTLKPDECLIIGDQIKVHQVKRRGDQIRVIIKAPRNMVIHRENAIKNGFELREDDNEG